MSTSNYPEDSDATRKLIASRAIVATRTKKIPDHSPPERIDRYRVLRQLGVGSFGNVYLAQDEFLERDVAIKVAHQATSDDNTLLAEARIAAKLDHPNIVTVFDIGRTNIDHEFIVSKFVDGADLCTLLQDGRLPVPDVVRIVSTIAAALDYSHRQSVIHRDIKPANILIDTEGTPFVADFGVATEQCNVVATGSKLIGSPLYMSPEQVQRDWFLLDARTDIFSLGVVLYEMLAGTPPFVANSIEELASQITNDIPTSLTTVNPAVPTKLQAVCSKAMHKARSERFQSAADFSSTVQSRLVLTKSFW